MKITVFTGNQPRHLSLIRSLASTGADVFAVMESNTVFPGLVQGFYDKSPVMQDYFGRVIDAEKEVFGCPEFMSSGIRCLVLKLDDLNLLSRESLSPGLESDLYVVFGSSFIKGDLIDFLVKHRAINIHMGVSPYYRGCDCNFWALHDHRPDLVGATIHMLSRGLDSGDMLFHALPEEGAADPFLLGMKAVKSAHNGLLQRIEDGTLLHGSAAKQEKNKEIRYSRQVEFNDDVAAKYLRHMPTADEVEVGLAKRDLGLFLKPFIDS